MEPKQQDFWTNINMLKGNQYVYFVNSAADSFFLMGMLVEGKVFSKVEVITKLFFSEIVLLNYYP